MTQDFGEIHIELDFWDDFIVEASEHIEAIESNAMSLEQNPENTDIIHTMFRAFHTIKGLSGFVEHTIIQEVAHKTETMMDYCRKGDLKVTTGVVDAILKSSDYIKQLCDNVEAYKDKDLVEKIKVLLVNLEELSELGEKDFAAQAVVPAKVETEAAKPQTEEEKAEEIVLEFPTIEPEEEIPAVEKAEELTAEEPKEEIKQEEPQEEEIEEEEEEEEKEETEEEPISQKEGLDIFAESIFEFGTNTQEEEIKEEKPEEQKEELIEESVPVEESIRQEEVSEPILENAELSEFQKNVAEKLQGEPSKAAQNTETAKESQNPKAQPANEEYMKVANHKIDHLVDMMGELIINQALIEQYVSVNYSDDRQLVANMSGFLRITRELQNLSMSLRMVGLKPTFQKLARIARDTIQELHKDVEFIPSGENTEIDRAVAEKMLDPLVHMIKNAISHGIEENSQDRINIGKSPRGKVEINAYSKRGKIFIEVKDDGKGINTEIVYQKALEKGIIDPNKTYTEAEIKEFIMLPGFSTAKVVDNISGRGVGMDVVKTQIFKLGGKVEIQSTLNEGSTFILEVPVNHAIMNGTIIAMNEQQFVVPTVNVKEFLQPTSSQWISTKGQRTMIKVRDNIIPLVPLSTFFKNVQEPKEVPLIMILELDEELRAVPIVNVVNRQEVVVKPVGTEFSHLRYISGMSILGDGKVSLILDIDYLFKKEVTE